MKFRLKNTVKRIFAISGGIDDSGEHYINLIPTKKMSDENTTPETTEGTIQETVNSLLKRVTTEEFKSEQRLFVVNDGKKCLFCTSQDEAREKMIECVNEFRKTITSAVSVAESKILLFRIPFNEGTQEELLSHFAECLENETFAILETVSIDRTGGSKHTIL